MVIRLKWPFEARPARRRLKRRRRRKRAREPGMVRWERWRRMLEDGTYNSRAELARGEGVSRAAVTIGLRKLDEAA
jgi:hypothetical protein